MKKTFFILISAGILFSVNANAQSTTSPAGIGTIIPDLGGEWGISIVVTDSKSNPVVGAKVVLPCSGEPNEYTNAKGTADFSGSGTCPCNESLVTVSTTQSRVQQAVTCTTNYVSLPQ